MNWAFLAAKKEKNLISAMQKKLMQLNKQPL